MPQHQDAQSEEDEEIGEEAEIMTGASIPGLLSIIPPFLSSAVRRDGNETNGELRAAVTMNFPTGRQQDTPCLITFAITDEKVESIALKLYNAHLERDGRKRFIYYDGDTRKARIGPQFTLQECTVEAIPQIFGPIINAGNCSSPPRLVEVRTGSHITQTVQMSEFHNVGDGAIITVVLNSTHASQIFEQLY